MVQAVNKSKYLQIVSQQGLARRNGPSKNTANRAKHRGYALFPTQLFVQTQTSLTTSQTEKYCVITQEHTKPQLQQIPFDPLK